MDEQINENPRPVNPRRRKRSRMQIFKEVYLPVIIAGAAVLMILIFIIGSIVRGVQKNKAEKEASIASSIALEEEQARLTAESESLLAQAQQLFAIYDYQGALDVLNSFSGDMNQYPAISDAIAQYEAAMDSLVAWDDPSQVTNLSFQMLMADPEQAFAHSDYGSAFNKNYVTTAEFGRILEELHRNGYVLVGMDDLYTATTAGNGTVTYAANTLYLPEGKKPLLLTQTNVNYNIYIVDGDGDKLPDKDGAGFACRLVLDDNGSVTCERIDRDGQTVTGDFDLVPILDNFVEANPDFSYKGAKAVLALTGYNGLFGYRTNSGAEEDFGLDAYNEAVAQAIKVAGALRDSGYELACYTYENVPYGEFSASMLETDLNKWLTECLPILGQVDTMVYAQQSDITNTEVYSGDKFATLQNAGFRYYLGFSQDGTPWSIIGADYIRHGRILVSGSNMAHNSQWFAGLFDTEYVLDRELRGTIPA